MAVEQARDARRPGWRWRREYWGYVCVMPAILWVAALFLVPLSSAILTSLEQDTPDGAVFVGLQNYERILLGTFARTLFWPSFGRTVGFTVAAVLSHLLVGLILAVLVNNAPWRTLFRGIVLIPWVMPGVVVAFIWLWMYQPQYGAVNGLLTHLGLGEWRTAWLGQPATALPAVLLASVWRHSVFDTMMLLAGLQAISKDYYEAAGIDGAGRWQAFRFVTLPMLRTIILTITLFDFIWSFGAFDLIWLMTGGGPMDSSHVLGTLVYRTGFRYVDIGEASAIATMMFVFVAIAAVSYVLIAQRLTPEHFE
jgi:multiple sugar transport system permease protein